MGNNSHLLLEIGTEELPPTFVTRGISQLKEKLSLKLSPSQLKYKKINTFGTPRRLVALVENLADKQEDSLEEICGPSKKVALDEKGNYTMAAKKFAHSQRVDLKELVIKEIKKGSYLFAIKKHKGLKASQILPEIIKNTLLELEFPKSMRWADESIRFPRPIRWIVCLLNNKVIKFNLNGITSSNKTYGHYFLAHGPFLVDEAKNYLKLIKEKKVILDYAEREKIILKQIKKEAEQIGGIVLYNPQILEEVTNLVEFPHTIGGDFPREYLSLPDGVLITTMEHHQRYFPLQDKKGKLINKFIVVHNGNPKYNHIIRTGHERVLFARLSDAKFFFEEDQKESFTQKTEALRGMIFQEKLGNLYDKVKRLEKLASLISHKINAENKIRRIAQRASYLSKTDLVTEMVNEFPELQGFMGREYAQISGEPKEVAQTIYEHYLPLTREDEIPESIAGKITSLADKIDTLVGYFGIGLAPTGSTDPFSLRRQAQGVVLIIINSKFSFSLREILKKNYQLYQEEKVELQSAQELIEELLSFFKQRLRFILTAEGARYDIIEAVLALPEDNLYDLALRVRVLQNFSRTKTFDDLLVAFERCYNLSLKARMTRVNPSLFQQKEEKIFYEELIKAEKNISEISDYKIKIKYLALLRPIIDKFFDEVLVMTDEAKIRQNRLSLIKRYAHQCLKIADFSKIQH